MKDLTKKEKYFLWEALEIHINKLDSNLDFLKDNAKYYNYKGIYSKEQIAYITENLECLMNIQDKL